METRAIEPMPPTTSGRSVLTTTTSSNSSKMNGQVRKRASSDIEISQSEPSYASGVRSDLLNNAVVTWLTFLQMEQYAEEFIDNGYDDLETVKKIGSEDLEAIGVTSTHHKSFLLDAVRVLRHQGATWVYLIQDKNRDSGLIPTDPEYDSCGERASGGSSGIASGNSSSIPWNDQDFCSGENTSSSSSTSSKPKMSTVSNGRIRPSPVSRTRCQVELEQQSQNAGSPASMRSRSLLEMTPDHLRVMPGKSLNGLGRVNHIHEEEDLIQRVSDLGVGSNKDPRQLGPSSPGNLAGLKLMLKERLKQESIQLCAPPFTSKNGDEYLSSLALRYSQELGYPQSEIQSSLEEIRFADWTNQAQLTSYQHTYANVIRDELQRTFQPGIYASSSCISDQEGEALYDFANKYQGRATLSSSKSKLSPSGFYDLAKKVICRRNQSASAFSTPIKFNRKQNALNDMDQRFMTRTRLRKGGPPHTPSLQRPLYSGSPEVHSVYGTPLMTMGRRDPPAGLDMSTFRTVNGRGGNRYPGSDLYFGTNGGPSTPLVMHKTSPNGSVPPMGRVQMFRTRVVYNEARGDVLPSKSQEASV